MCKSIYLYFNEQYKLLCVVFVHESEKSCVFFLAKTSFGLKNNSHGKPFGLCNVKSNGRKEY